MIPAASPPSPDTLAPDEDENDDDEEEEDEDVKEKLLPLSAFDFSREDEADDAVIWAI